MEAKLILESIKESIKQVDPKAVVYLFGSRARNDHHDSSDWDILILVDNSKNINELEDKFRDRLYDIELEIGQIISTFIYPKEYWNKQLKPSPFYESITEEGILL